jgi:endonuclease/exonuclease/phosphatase family metal-dependent hydrolase
VILAGDFTSRPGDVVLQRLTRDWLVVPKEGDRFTFPADVPDREIDFIMLRPAEAFEILEHRVVNEAVASDHRPLLALLRLW